MRRTVARDADWPARIAAGCPLTDWHSRVACSHSACRGGTSATVQRARNHATASGRKKMDGARFDSIARTLAGRLSRRTALRGTGAGVAAGLFSAPKSETGRAAVMHQGATLPYVVVRHYSLSASVSNLQQALGQYATQLA